MSPVVVPAGAERAPVESLTVARDGEIVLVLDTATTLSVMRYVVEQRLTVQVTAEAHDMHYVTLRGSVSMNGEAYMQLLASLYAIVQPDTYQHRLTRVREAAEAVATEAP
jgi:hypothetical protein